MCGIAGLIGPGARDPATVRRMIGTIAHRGPDDGGLWIDPEAEIALGHRRLSIVDLSPSGHQPMASTDGRWMLSFNGEIYNHRDLRAKLDSSQNCGHWRGQSDTETLVECIAKWGLETALQECVGMFALAVWDRHERTLHLARDRFGEKPLYYGWACGNFVFASELKAIRATADFSNSVSRSAVRLLVSRNYIPAPLSIFEGIYKLEPGCTLAALRGVASSPSPVPPEPGVEGGRISIRHYWSYRGVVEAGLRDPIHDEREALDKLEEALALAIRGQSVADVPVGAFLSGGIDSSTIVSLYQKYSSTKVRTFSIGFEEAAFNEANFAKEVARHLGTEHNERYVTVREAQSVIPLLPTIYDEPFADSSQIPTYLVSRFAREQVTVALSGDGGDELFGGYTRYHSAAKLWGKMQKLPGPIRSVLGGGLGQLPPSAWATIATLLPGASRRPHLGAKVQKGLKAIGAARSLGDVYDSFLDEWSAEGSPVLDGDLPLASHGYDLNVGIPAPDVVRMMYCDATNYLPDDILCKVDRAAMSVSLETRVPFLDHRVAAVAARIPANLKIRGSKGKYLLRKLLYREVPESLFERPKAGFAIPVGEWIRGPLREWAESLLDAHKLREQGYFDPVPIRRRWQQHLDRDRDGSEALWSVLMFQAWLSHDNMANASISPAIAAETKLA